MTPKEKAEELIEKYKQYSQLEIGYQGITSRIQSAKKCALIAVDEIINNNNKIPGNVNGLHTIENTSYWEQVKQEVER
jgi:hypothetical protein